MGHMSPAENISKQQEFVLRTIEERDIRFIRLWFTDVLGTLKNVAVAPADTPAATVKKLTADFQAVLNDPEIKSKLTQGGFDVQASDGPTLDKHVKREFDRWQQFVKNTRLNLED